MVFNMNEEFIHYVDRRLDEWANWYSKGNSYGLGYPQRSMEYILMTEGSLIKYSVPQHLPCNEDAEEIEMLICEMAKQNKTMAYILRYHYFSTGALRGKAKNFSSDYTSISYRKFKEYVDLARQWLAGRLSAKYTL
jgi:hypothetical protein